MDVLVTWRDGTENVVCTKEIQTVKKGEEFQLGVKIKMLFKRRWYYGTITAIEMNVSSSDDEPLSNYADQKKTEHNNTCEYKDCHNIVLTTCFQCGCFLCAEHLETNESCLIKHFPNIATTSNQEPKSNQVPNCTTEDDNCTFEYTVTLGHNEHVKYCEFSTCTDEVYAACPHCSCFLCWDHFIESDLSCINHFSSAQNFKISTGLSVLHTNKQTCEFTSCTNPVLATCFVCNCFLCDIHFGTTAEESCSNHSQLEYHVQNQEQLKEPFIEEPLTDCEEMDVHILNVSSETAVLLDDLNESPSILRHGDSDIEQSLFCEYPACLNLISSNCSNCNLPLCSEHLSVHIASFHQSLSQANNLQPEDFVVDGSPRENSQAKQKRCNKFKLAKNRRQQGKEYISPYTKKLVSEKKVGAICNLEYCAKYGNYCYLFTEKDRENILLDYYSTGKLEIQREFIARFTEKKPVARRTTASESRRQFTLNFYLPLKDEKHKVCKKMFLNTLAISEKSVRTSLDKLKTTGVLEKDRRGGRQGTYTTEDAKKRADIKAHLNRFPRVESHYCRKDSMKEYLHPDLTLRKMHAMFLQEYQTKVSFTLYRSIFKEMNLSIHRPKKDLCGLCATYREGTTEVKEKLQEKYTRHISEKEEVRKIKADCKNECSNTVRCASFDLQQVIYLPQSNESAIFYKRRLANYNFTIYDLDSKECTCNLWHEAISKRGASEISTALFYFLTHYDSQGVKKVYLFSDGCQGQNKNSVVASMLLYFMMHCDSVEEISLRFFCPSHGQSEGDSVHSAVSYALSKAGNIFVPSQLVPIVRLARRTPYNVKEYNHNDFLNFKEFSHNIKLLQLRKDDLKSEPVKWTDMMEFRVVKSKPGTLFFKTSHLEKEYRSVTVKRLNFNHFRNEIDTINKTPSDKRITKEKYDDLLSMCTGDTPIIRNQEHVLFYKSLPHD